MHNGNRGFPALTPMSIPVSESPAVYVQQRSLRLAGRAAGSVADGAAARGQAVGAARKAASPGVSGGGHRARAPTTQLCDLAQGCPGGRAMAVVNRWPRGLSAQSKCLF